jgi:hypothetical protein
MAFARCTVILLATFMCAYADESFQESQSRCEESAGVASSHEAALLQVGSKVREHQAQAAESAKIVQSTESMEKTPSKEEYYDEEEKYHHAPSHKTVQHRVQEGEKQKQQSLSQEHGVESEESVEGPPEKKALEGARIAPFGKTDTGRELQHHAARTQDTLVDAIENAEVAEIKRSIFRSLTRLRAAEIKEFDTIARLQTQAIDEYNDNHHYRAENPLDYIHNPEGKVTEDKFTSFHD